MRNFPALARLRPVDLLLPVGAALVSAGLQNLADRERRARARLEQMSELAKSHLEDFAAAGVTVPEQLAADEQHPLDPEVPWLSMLHAGVDRSDDEPPADVPRARRRWKGAALALAAVAGVVVLRNADRISAWAASLVPESPEELAADQYARDAFAGKVDPPAGPFGEQPLGNGMTFDHDTGDVIDPDGNRICPTTSRSITVLAESALGADIVGTFGCCGGPVNAAVVCHVTPAEPDSRDEQPGPACGHEGHPATSHTCAIGGVPLSAAAFTAEPGPAAIASCGWPNCDWTSDPQRSELAQTTQAAVHRNRCVFRPSGAQVSG